MASYLMLNIENNATVCPCWVLKLTIVQRVLDKRGYETLYQSITASRDTAANPFD